jgi:hypothetical protein
VGSIALHSMCSQLIICASLKEQAVHTCLCLLFAVFTQMLALLVSERRRQLKKYVPFACKFHVLNVYTPPFSFTDLHLHNRHLPLPCRRSHLRLAVSAPCCLLRKFTHKHRQAPNSDCLLGTLLTTMKPSRTSRLVPLIKSVINHSHIRFVLLESAYVANAFGWPVD